MADGREAGTLFTQSGGMALAHMRFERMEGALTAGEAALQVEAVGRREHLRREDPGREVVVAHEGAEHLGHGDAVLRRLPHLDGVADQEHTGLDHREVRTGSASLGEPAHPPPLPHPGGEGRARDPRSRHLEHRRAHRPPLTDDSGIHIESEGGEVLPEHAVPQVPAELGAPPVQLLARHGIHRLL